MSALIDLPRRVLSSTLARLIALGALAGAVLVAASIPQGWVADSYLLAPDPGPLRDWATWGLTELPQQPIFWALVVLFVGTGLLAAARSRGRTFEADPAAELSLRAESARPEDAPEEMAAVLRSHLGEPQHAEWDGKTTRLAYRLGPRPADGLRTVLGLAVVFVTSAYVLQPPAESKTVARAWLSAEEVRSGARGTFDLVQGEEFTFFQSQDVYVLRGYAADRLGLGPALQLQWSDGERVGSFWLYEDAPGGFDRRHRQADVALDVLEARLEPIPGAGPTARPASWGLILGLGLLMMGAAARLQTPVTAAVECAGKDIRLQLGGPPSASRARLWSRLRAAVEEVFPVASASDGAPGPAQDASV